MASGDPRGPRRTRPRAILLTASRSDGRSARAPRRSAHGRPVPSDLPAPTPHLHGRDCAGAVLERGDGPIPGYTAAGGGADVRGALPRRRCLAGLGGKRAVARLLGTDTA